MDDAVAVLQGVSKSYRMDAVEVPVLREVDLLVRPGVFTVLLGPSGSGKTTLLNNLGGLDLPTAGELRYRDLDLTQADLARAVSCATITIAKIEHDERRPSRQMAALAEQSFG